MIIFHILLFVYSVLFKKLFSTFFASRAPSTLHAPTSQEVSLRLILSNNELGATEALKMYGYTNKDGTVFPAVGGRRNGSART
jgi:hypothetical protein